MEQMETKSLLERFEEAAKRPVPYEGLVQDAVAAGYPPVPAKPIPAADDEESLINVP